MFNTNDNFVQILLIFLATWRVSNLLVSENGLFNVFLYIRHLVGIRYYYYDSNQGQHVYLDYNQVKDARFSLESFTIDLKHTISELFSCIYCMSVWVALLFTIIYYFNPQLTFFITLWLSASTAAILLKKFI